MNKYVKELVYVNYYPHLCYMMVQDVRVPRGIGGYSSDDYS
jgi:hypothetical protein